MVALNQIWRNTASVLTLTQKLVKYNIANNVNEVISLIKKGTAMEKIVFGIPILGVIGFFIWCGWVTNPKHPERIKALREKFRATSAK